ncbi:MAG: hypothetical protein Q9N68_03595, partial [Gammaproteobacteria bacterium]|nr:hypothetical protein [Gammaproteobacteria bacterium]
FLSSLLSAIFFLSLLTACGTREEPTSTVNNGGGTTVTSPAPSTPTITTPDAILSVTLQADSRQLSSGNAGKVILSVRIKDVGNQLVQGETVTFSATSGDLAVTQGVTDGLGVAVAELLPGTDVSNRSITVTAVAAGASDSITIEVVGSSMSVDGPSAVTVESSADLSFSLLDGNGDPIVGAAVVVSSARGNVVVQPPLTNSSGQTQATVIDSVGLDDVITASALAGTVTASFNLTVRPDRFHFQTPLNAAEISIGNVGKLVSVQWLQNGQPVVGQTVQLNTTRGLFLNGLATQTATTNGFGVVENVIHSSNAGAAVMTAKAANGSIAQRTIEFVATNPASLTLQASPTTLGGGETSNISAIVRDAQGNLVKNQTVVFAILSDVSGGSLSVGSALSNSSGMAGTVYTAGVGGPNSAVLSATVANNVGVQITSAVNLTVGQKALRMVLGTGKEASQVNVVQNQKSYVVQVSNAQGAPVSGVRVELSVQPLAYFKGQHEGVDTLLDGKPDSWVIVRSVECLSEDLNQNGVLDNDLASNCNAQLDPNEDLNGNGILDFPEDLNNNGILDAGEDLDGDGLLDLSLEDHRSGEDRNCSGTLEPSNSATIAQHPTMLPTVNAGALLTDANGFGYFSVVYPKSHARWVTVRLKARALVAGSESVESVDFTLPGLVLDYNTIGVEPPGIISPYGAALDCTIPR